MPRSHNPNDVERPDDDTDLGPWMEEAELMTRDWEHNPFSGSQAVIGTPELRTEYVRKLAELLRESSGVQPPQRAQEPGDEAVLSKEADDKFWNSDEPKQYTRKKL